MRLLLIASAVCVLLISFAWVLLRGAGNDAPEYALALHAFDDFALAEASLYRDVLRARAGLLRDYDPLNQAVAKMNDAVAHLRFYATAEELDTTPVDRLAEMVAQQEALTERFKTSNALLQNSLSYFGFLSASPAIGAQDAQLAPATGELAAAILRLTLDTSPESVRAVQERLDQLATRASPAGPDAKTVQTLLAHAHLLHELLPAIDKTVKALLAIPDTHPLAPIRFLFSERHATAEATTQRLRLLLVMTSLLLLLSLLDLGRRLRARAHALRLRAAFEHVIAENSTRLINCPPTETDARLRAVLGELGRAMGVERAYVVLDENPARAHVWCADGTSYPTGWPHQALALSKGLGATGTEIMTVPNVAALPPGESRDILARAGVRGWACVPLIRPGRIDGIMAFDAVQRAWHRIFPLPDLLRLAGDAVTNAIDREFLERDRIKLMTRLERARRMQTVGSLASGIAHNFNNILGAILGYAEMAEAQLRLVATPIEHIEEIRRATERGRDLIEGILTFGRRRDARARPVQARALLDEAASLLRASLPQGIELAMGDVPAHVAVFGEPVQLQQVILNLCTNASQAMAGSGCIHVTAELQDLAAPLALSHGELAAGRYVCIAVSDNGRGFDEDVARQLFKPFFTTRLAGTGLGLATVREIVADHDGAVNVLSVPGQGSRFEAWLPEAAANAGVLSTAGNVQDLSLGRGETVMIIESERERRLRDEEMLAALGYEPVGFERPADAMAACRAEPARFDAIVVSHPWSTESALDLARALREILSRQPILLTTASANDVGVHALAEAGVAEILNRPLVSTELAAALSRCLRSSGKLQP